MMQIVLENPFNAITIVVCFASVIVGYIQLCTCAPRRDSIKNQD